MNENTFDNDTAALDAAAAAVAPARCWLAAWKLRASRYSSLADASSVMNPATDSIVGWSKRSVCGNSVANRSAIAFANSVAETESSPAAIRGEFAVIVVPSTWRSDAEMVSPTEVASREAGDSQGAASQQILLLATTCESDLLPSASKKQAIARSDGWSNSSVDGSSVQRRSLSRVESSVAPTESSPVDMSGASGEMVVPPSSVAVLVSSSRRRRLEA